MSSKKRAKHAELDDATTAAIAKLNALSFEATDPLNPPAYLREYIKPGQYMKGRPNEYVTQTEDLENSDEEQESLSDEEDLDNLDEGFDQNWLELGDHDRCHVSVYLGQEWVEAIVSYSTDHGLFSQLTDTTASPRRHRAGRDTRPPPNTACMAKERSRPRPLALRAT
jgi:hypothetical protein